MSIRAIDVEELARAVESGAVVLDVREPDELAEARVPGVLPIPLGELPARVTEVPGGDTVYVICRSGARSLKACEQLVAVGIDAVNVSGGTLAWIDSGRPTDSGPTA